MRKILIFITYGRKISQMTIEHAQETIEYLIEELEITREGLY